MVLPRPISSAKIEFCLQMKNIVKKIKIKLLARSLKLGLFVNARDSRLVGGLKKWRYCGINPNQKAVEVLVMQEWQQINLFQLSSPL